ncbi:hypothetical protein OBBRIDRAFT_824191 [Obba rivulosa]|uniref:Uncharacterized protein n=1 Tax=Obba rivulosa TaxID=1052685 RepID=A0A8E2DP83_9APHY|nr:hypothetical protein OBBRIDRAFT_824191 [Obba rivulosa]
MAPYLPATASIEPGTSLVPHDRRDPLETTERQLHTQASNSDGILQSPGAITMQTTVAIRDENPHRFKIMRLRQLRRSGIDLPTADVFDLYATPRRDPMADLARRSDRSPGRASSAGTEPDSLVSNDQGSPQSRGRNREAPDTGYRQPEENRSHVPIDDPMTTPTGANRSFGHRAMASDYGARYDLFTPASQHLQRASASHDTLASDSLDASLSWGSIDNHQGVRTLFDTIRMQNELQDETPSRRSRGRSATVSEVSITAPRHRETLASAARREFISDRRRLALRRQAIYAGEGVVLPFLAEGRTNPSIACDLTFHGTDAPSLRLPAVEDSRHEGSEDVEVLPEGTYIIPKGFYIREEGGEYLPQERRFLLPCKPLRQRLRDSVDAVVRAALSGAPSGHWGREERVQSIMQEMMEEIDVDIMSWRPLESEIVSFQSKSDHPGPSKPVPF